MVQSVCVCKYEIVLARRVNGGRRLEQRSHIHNTIYIVSQVNYENFTMKLGWWTAMDLNNDTACSSTVQCGNALYIYKCVFTISVNSHRDSQQPTTDLFVV